MLPLNGASQIGLGEALILNGDPDAATKSFDAAIDVVDQPQLRDEIALLTAPLTGK